MLCAVATVRSGEPAEMQQRGPVHGGTAEVSYACVLILCLQGTLYIRLSNAQSWGTHLPRDHLIPGQMSQRPRVTQQAQLSSRQLQVRRIYLAHFTLSPLNRACLRYINSLCGSLLQVRLVQQRGRVLVPQANHSTQMSLALTWMNPFLISMAWHHPA